ncbi:MAG: CRISPR-associated endonuclease Cas1 [Desulfobacterales bacterium]|nr:CRISPR-associated endonuclease Cas1 [Desulfobacterales bacterium]
METAQVIRKAAEVIPIGAQAAAQPLLQAQYDLFTGEAKAIPIVVDREFDVEHRVSDEIVLARSGDAAQLILSGFGLFLSKKSDRLIVKKGKDLIYEFPFFRLSEVTVASRGITLSSDLIMELCQRGVQINFMQGTGRPYAKLSSPMLSATIQARREQIRAIDEERGVKFSKIVVSGKLRNQRNLLLYFGKYLKKAHPERYEALEKHTALLSSHEKNVRVVKGSTLEEVRNSLLGIEGISGRIYWEGVQEIVKGRAEFFGRVHRGATDKVNALFNYGYGILYSQVWGAVVSAGLEPFAGFLHVDRPGKPSLVLDLVEEFRQPVVDRTVISYINLGEAMEMEGGLLDAGTRKSISQKILERLEARETYQGKKYQIRSAIQIQARNLAAFLRGEREYKTFSFKW